jgi:hypothetical protein
MPWIFRVFHQRVCCSVIVCFQGDSQYPDYDRASFSRYNFFLCSIATVRVWLTDSSRVVFAWQFGVHCSLQCVYFCAFLLICYQLLRIGFYWFPVATLLIEWATEPRRQVSLTLQLYLGENSVCVFGKLRAIGRKGEAGVLFSVCFLLYPFSLKSPSQIGWLLRCK